MEEAELIEYIEKWGGTFEADIKRRLENLEKRIKGLERDLWSKFIEGFSDIFNTSGRALEKSTANIYATNRRLESIFDSFENEESRREIEIFAKELIEIGENTNNYFLNVFGDEATVAERRNSLSLLLASMGIATVAGAIVPDGYLQRLGRFEGARADIQGYSTQSIVTGRGVTDFQRGLRNLILGTSDNNGVLRAWWAQYANDAYNQAHEIVNTNMAAELDLTYFIYQGDLIPTSRKFCIERAGKVFSKQEALTWKNDPDLIDPKTAASYNPFIERGRYNCRHWLNWISEALAFQLRPDLKKQQ
jgi:hypothetical protein